MERITIAAFIGSIFLISGGVYVAHVATAQKQVHLASSQSNAHQLTAQEIQTLKNMLTANGGEVYEPGDGFQYDRYRMAWNGKCNKHPYVIFAPANNDDASAVIKQIVRAGEIFTIISGGHDFECQSSSDKVLISTKLLNRIELDMANNQVTVGAGALWRDINRKLQGSGMFSIGPTNPSISVSGFTLGGGFNWYLSRFFGIAAENVKAMAVVLASGEVITADRTNKYQILTKGLLGCGGEQLGLVLDFTINLHSFSSVNDFILLYHFRDEVRSGQYAVEDYKEIFKAWVKVIDGMQDNSQIGGVSISVGRSWGFGIEKRSYYMTVKGVCQGCNWQNALSILNRYKPTSISALDRSLDILEFQDAYQERVHFPESYSSAYTSAYLSTFDDAAIDVVTDRFINPPGLPTWDTGISLEVNMIKGSVKDKRLTSFSAPDAVWRIMQKFIVPEERDTSHFDDIRTKWNTSIKEASGDGYLGGDINTLDATLNQRDYYGSLINFNTLRKLKKRYDSYNVFRRMKGIYSQD